VLDRCGTGQQQANLRILSMWGTADGGTSIFALTEKQASMMQGGMERWRTLSG
jgi:hypothetical protein